MGGTLAVDSRPGAGSTFHFELAFGLAAAEIEGRLAPAAPRRALVIEANDSAAAALCAALQGYGWGDGLRRQRGRSAVTGARDDGLRPGVRRPCLGVLHAAGKRGRAATGRARRRRAAMCAPCRVGGRAGSSRHPRQALHAVGAARPAFRTGRRRARPSAAGPALAAARLAGLRVLVAEDNPVTQEVARHILLHAGAQPSFAGDGRAALELLGERGADFDVVLMDLQMPVMNGFDATAAIRARGLTLPVVAMTANAMDEDRRAALAAGMDAHLAKPVDVDDLVATLARVSGRAAQAASLPSAQLPAARDDVVPGIALAEALPRFGGDLARFTAVFQRFAAGQEGTAAALRARLDRGERGEAAQDLHRLRGVAANLGAVDVAAVALALELALPHTDGAALDAHLAALEAALATMADVARTLAPAQSAAPAGRAEATQDALAQLCELLQNNNMKAVAAWEALRAPLAARLDAGDATELADAVGSLRFERAAALVRAILEPKGEA
ncbi:response regulator [Massilia sp. Dwa41.01b]|uniref:response regulator n=2 Tax=unclassified Massilia TaxID=2609279 RepID=UPI0016027AB2|nr:response regulator [Massilia sp. Dwa41.01b]